MLKPSLVRCPRVLGALLGLVLGCSSAPKAPVSNAPAALPDMSGQSVLLLPVQPGPVPGPVVTATGDVKLDGVNQLDAELAYWLKEQAANVTWVMPEAIDRLLSRTPALDIKPRSLDVAIFRRAQVRRIGDPLFGDLKRLATILNARFALVPIAAEYKAGTGVHVAFALIDTTFGDVIWFGVLAGDTPAAAAQRAAILFAPRKSNSGADK